MKYTLIERLNIGRRIYLGELTLATAAYAYDINMYTARDYLRMYKASAQLSTYDRQDESMFDTREKPNLSINVGTSIDLNPNQSADASLNQNRIIRNSGGASDCKLDLTRLKHMTKEELIAEVIKAKEENLQRQG